MLRPHIWGVGGDGEHVISLTCFFVSSQPYENQEGIVEWDS